MDQQPAPYPPVHTNTGRLVFIVVAILAIGATSTLCGFIVAAVDPRVDTGTTFMFGSFAGILAVAAVRVAILWLGQRAKRQAAQAGG